MIWRDESAQNSLRFPLGFGSHSGGRSLDHQMVGY
jgi:hypothetical protein